MSFLSSLSTLFTHKVMGKQIIDNLKPVDQKLNQDKNKMNITPNFSIEEFKCKDGTPYPDKWVSDRLKPLCEALEIIRKTIETPIHISSGYRSPEHNKKVSLATKSEHVEGRAVDIVTRTLSPLKLYNTIEKLISDNKIPQGGLGLYRSWVHYDIRGVKARWRG